MGKRTLNQDETFFIKKKKDKTSIDSMVPWSTPLSHNSMVFEPHNSTINRFSLSLTMWETDSLF